MVIEQPFENLEDQEDEQKKPVQGKEPADAQPQKSAKRWYGCDGLVVVINYKTGQNEEKIYEQITVPHDTQWSEMAVDAHRHMHNCDDRRGNSPKRVELPEIYLGWIAGGESLHF